MNPVALYSPPRTLWDALHDRLCMHDPSGNRLCCCVLPKNHQGLHRPVKMDEVLIAAAILRRQKRI